MSAIFAVMADPISTPASSAGSAATAAPLNAPDFFFALGSELRWRIFQLLLDGKPRPATEVAAALKRDFDGVSKHLRLMRAAGVLSVVPAEDRRYVLFTIPSERWQDAALDYGICLIRPPQSATGRNSIPSPAP